MDGENCRHYNDQTERCKPCVSTLVGLSPQTEIETSLGGISDIEISHNYPNIDAIYSDVGVSIGISNLTSVFPRC